MPPLPFRSRLLSNLLSNLFPDAFLDASRVSPISQLRINSASLVFLPNGRSKLSVRTMLDCDRVNALDGRLIEPSLDFQCRCGKSASYNKDDCCHGVDAPRRDHFIFTEYPRLDVRVYTRCSANA
jgi:hypothetical protein